MKLQRYKKNILILFIFALSTLTIAQDKQQFLKYIKSVENRLDSIKKTLSKYETETQTKVELLQEQNNQLSKTTKVLEEKRAEIKKLNDDINEKIAFIDSQEGFLIGFMAITAIALIAVISLIATIKDKKRINTNLEEKSEVIKKQVVELKQKNREITDSIKYAKRIQDAILPTPSEIKTAIPNSFIYYRPKDIVSGDFYWLTELNNKIYFVTADCTGHGVPGALMSMLGISFLNEIVNEKNFHKPSEIMDELKKSIINSLNKSDTSGGIKDGMDMSLYSFDKQNLKLTYSGANNGLYIIRENNIIKLDPDKQPVSASPKDHLAFNEFVFDLKENDFIISYSDGFADQFGGPKGKKYKYKQLQELLIQVKSKPINTIPSLLNSVFEKWKGSLEQVDDVIIVGVKV